jgi:hypothetical protein
MHERIWKIEAEIQAFAPAPVTGDRVGSIKSLVLKRTFLVVDILNKIYLLKWLCIRNTFMSAD